MENHDLLHKHYFKTFLNNLILLHKYACIFSRKKRLTLIMEVQGRIVIDRSSLVENIDRKHVLRNFCGSVDRHDKTVG